MSTKISSNDKFVETVNQNFFIRSTITTVAKLALAELIFSGLMLLNYAIFMVGSRESIAAITLFFVITIVVTVIFLYYFVHSVNNLLTLHKKVTKVERSIIKSMK